eukprot:m51a1_g1181 hypothetical protein (142) ;mRNA; f:389231-389656
MNKSTLLCVLALVIAARATIYRRTASVPTESIVSTNEWTRFDAVTLSFNLPSPKLVTLQYNAGCGSYPAVSHMVTNLRVDGQVVPGSTTLNGNVYWHTNTVLVPVELAAGNHVVELWYRTPSTDTYCTENGWGGLVLTAAF